jgi:hypothetical protein
MDHAWERALELAWDAWASLAELRSALHGTI